MSIYRSATQTSILFILLVSSTSVFEKLIDINNTLKRIEYQMKIQNYQHSKSFNENSLSFNCRELNENKTD